MKRRFLLIMIACAIVGCGKEVKPETSKNYPSKDVVPPDTTHTEEQVMLMSSVVYPDDYDWIRDDNAGIVDCTLQFGTIDQILFSQKATNANKVSAHWDQHRILDSNLYDDWYDEGNTYFRKNGQELFKFDKKELITDAKILDGDIYTLSVSRDQEEGYVLRKNGEIYAQSKEMVPLSGLYIDKGQLCLSLMHCEKDGSTRIAILTNGNPLNLRTLDKSEKIIDYRRVNGIPCAFVQQDNNCVILYGDSNVIRVNKPYSNRGFDMVFDGITLYVSYKFSSSGAERFEVRRLNLGTGSLSVVVNFDYNLFDPQFFTAINGNTFIIGKHRLTGEYFYIVNGKEEKIPQGYKPAGSFPIYLDDKHGVMSLIDKNNNAALWMDGEIKDLGFHGYVDHMASGYVTRIGLVTDRH